MAHYAAFVSYSSADQANASKIQRWIERYSIPSPLRTRETSFGKIGARVGKLCRDRSDFHAGMNLQETIETALRNSSGLIVLCSPKAAQSKWVNREIEFYKSLGREHRIFPLVIEGAPPGEPFDSVFPPALLASSDGENKSLPIAGDARADKDGYQNAILKILAGLLDVEYDELRQRELEAAKKRSRRTTVAVAAFGAIAVMAMVASYLAIQQKGVAQENLDHALSTAESLAIRSAEWRNRSDLPRDILMEMLSTSRCELRSLLAKDWRSPKNATCDAIVFSPSRALMRDAKPYFAYTAGMLSLSEAYNDIGFANLSLESAQEVLAIASAIQVKKIAVDWVYLADLTIPEAELKVGRAEQQRGRYAAALTAYEKCTRKYENLIGEWEDLGEDRASAVQGLTACKLGEISLLKAQGILSKAESIYQSIGYQEELSEQTLAEIRSKNIELSISKGEFDNAKNGLTELEQFTAKMKSGEIDSLFSKVLTGLLNSDLQLASGKISAAITAASESVVNLENITAQQPDFRTAGHLRAAALQKRAAAHAMAGNLIAANSDLQEAANYLSELHAHDPIRRDWRQSLANVAIQHTDLFFRAFESGSKSLLCADSCLQRAMEQCVVAKELVKDTQALDEALANTSIRASIACARLYRANGAFSKAEKELAQAEILFPNDEGPDDTGQSPLWMMLRAGLLDERADIATAKGDYDIAKSHYESAISIVRDLHQSNIGMSALVRDLLWFQLKYAELMAAHGAKDEMQTAFGEACRTSKESTIVGYHLLDRDIAAALEQLSERGISC